MTPPCCTVTSSSNAARFASHLARSAIRALPSWSAEEPLFDPDLRRLPGGGGPCDDTHEKHRDTEHGDPSNDRAHRVPPSGESCGQCDTRPLGRHQPGHHGLFPSIRGGSLPAVSGALKTPGKGAGHHMAEEALEEVVTALMSFLNISLRT